MNRLKKWIRYATDFIALILNVLRIKEPIEEMDQVRA
mgnify:CR=1 FL=1